MRLLALITLCILGAIAGHHLGWRNALSAPEIDAAFTFAPQSPQPPSSKTPPARKIDPETALTQTLPAALRAMRDRDFDAFHQNLRELETLSATDLEYMLQETDPDDRVFQGIFELLVRIDPLRAFHFISDLLPGEQSARLREMGFSRWSAKDPVAAWDALQSEDFPRWHTTPGSPESTVLKHWSAQDLESALAAWSSLDENLQKNAFSGFSRNFAGDPEVRAQLFDFLAGQPANAGRQWAVGNLLQRWVGQQGFAPAAQWIEHQASGYTAEDIAEFQRKIAFSGMYSAPDATIAWLMERSTPDRLADDLEAIVFGWSISEPGATGEWLASLDLGPDTDKAVARFARTIERDDPQSAYAWAQRITDPLERDHVSRSVLSAWNEIDPAAAAEAASQ